MQFNDMKNSFYKIFQSRRAFSLAEVLAALTIGSMILVAVLSIYRRAQNSAQAITERLGSSQLSSEVLQRIAEDLDSIITSGSDTKITIDSSKFDHGFQTAQLKILKTIYDDETNPLEFEQIIWQTNYDYDTDSLALYRSHSGIALEDKLFDEKRKDWEEEYPYVPICTGITFFKIQVPEGEDFLDKWAKDKLPSGVVTAISFAEPFETLEGTLDVPEEERITRTTALDRTRKIKFIIVKEDYEGQEGDEEGSEVSDANENKEEIINEPIIRKPE